jgi:uroporphyrinogen III methyltransferase/synthase
MPQEQINQVLLEEAQKGFRVVRLKGGDPFLFGRGGEELELLTQYGIPYEVVPGVTSPLAVPAYNGIPVTHRDFCSSLHIITGHKREGKKYDINFRALVETKGTLVFLMGVTALGDICQGLLENGMDPDMPAAILQKGTTAGQKRIVATVSTLKEGNRDTGYYRGRKGLQSGREICLDGEASSGRLEGAGDKTACTCFGNSTEAS